MQVQDSVSNVVEQILIDKQSKKLDKWSELVANRNTKILEALKKDETKIDWSISQLGARAEYRFANPAPINGSDSADASDDELDEYMHLFTINRDILMTPFHNMALMCPVTKESDVDRHTEIFREAVNSII